MRLTLLGVAPPPAVLAMPPARRAADAPYDVLVFCKTAGFRHDSIAVGIQAIRDLGAANSFTVTATEDANAFTTANLAQYEAVVFLNTTGDVLNDTQQTAFESYIRSGGGLRRRARRRRHRVQLAVLRQPGRRVLRLAPGDPAGQRQGREPGHAATAHLPQTWTRTDEWYNYQTNVAVDRTRARHARRVVVHRRRRWAPTTRTPGARRTTAAARSTPAAGTPRPPTPKPTSAPTCSAASVTRPDAPRPTAAPRPATRTLYNGSTTGWSQAGPGSFTNSDATLTSVRRHGPVLVQRQAVHLVLAEAGLDACPATTTPASSSASRRRPTRGRRSTTATRSRSTRPTPPTAPPASVYTFQSANIAARDAALNPAGEWNTYELLVEGERLRVYLNGVADQRLHQHQPGPRPGRPHRHPEPRRGRRRARSATSASRSSGTPPVGDVTVQAESFSAGQRRAGVHQGGRQQRPDARLHRAGRLGGVQRRQRRRRRPPSGRASSPAVRAAASRCAPGRTTGPILGIGGGAQHRQLDHLRQRADQPDRGAVGQPERVPDLHRHRHRPVRRRRLHLREGPPRRAPGRSWAWPASAWTCATAAPPTARRSSSTPATAARPRPGPATARPCGRWASAWTSPAAARANGTKIQLWTCNGTGAQNWTARRPTAHCATRSSGKCLDVSGNNSADGTQIHLWTCDGAANQRWTTP